MPAQLTIILIEDTEKPPQMTDRFFRALAALNAEAADRVEIVAISQRPDVADLTRAKAQSPFPVTVVNAGHPRAANGYPIWDICSAVRNVWDRIEGRYLTFAHTEFCYGPNRLARTLEWLDDRKPIICLGNLRRPGTRADQGGVRSSDNDGGIGDLIARLLDQGDGDCLVRLWPHLTTHHWIFWDPEHPEPRSGNWQEDIFFARRDWLERLRFFDHEAGRMAFQDIYDLMRAAFGRLKDRQLAPDCAKMPRSVNEALHLPHARPRSCFCREVLKYFQTHRSDWSHTAYLREDLWPPFLSPHGRPVARTRSLRAFRLGVGGTVTRWEAAFKAYLADGGATAISEYMHGGGAQ